MGCTFRTVPNRIVSRRSVFACGLLGMFVLLSIPRSLAAQDWFRTGTGLGVAKPRVAVADVAPKTPAAENFATLFSDVVRNDLDFSGILELVSKSFNPVQAPSVPAELTAAGWTEAPAS